MESVPYDSDLEKYGSMDKPLIGRKLIYIY